MKKIISLLIIAVMMVLPLASCNKNSDNNVRTTITEDEWDALDNITNYTCNIKGTDYQFIFGTHHGQNYTSTIKVTEKAEHTFYKFGYDSDAETNEYYYFVENGESYRLSKSSDESWKAKTSNLTPDSLLEYITYDEVEFDDLTYNKNNNAYTCTVKDDDCTLTFTYYFKAGTLTKFEFRYSEVEGDRYEETVTFSNIGTTTVTLPEYTIEE